MQNVSGVLFRTDFRTKNSEILLKQTKNETAGNNICENDSFTAAFYR